MPFNVPDPAKYRGVALRRWVEDVASYLTRTRISAGPGIALDETPGGIVLRASVGGAGLAIIKTTSSITARSSTTPGTGSATLVTWNGTALGTGATITLRHISATSAASGKYGFAVMLFGLYWLVSVECA